MHHYEQHHPHSRHRLALQRLDPGNARARRPLRPGGGTWERC